MLAMHGAYNLLSTADDAPAGKGGLPRATVLYPPIDVQAMRPAENFLKNVQDILRVRKQTGIAAGRFVTRLPTKNPGSIALLFALPGNQGAVLTICNFSRTSSHETFNPGAPEMQPFARGGVRHIWGAFTDISSVSLGPWQGTAFLLGKMPDSSSTGGPPSLVVASGNALDTADASLSASETAAPKSPYTPGIQRLKRGEKSHVIQAGEQLDVIAVRYKVTPEAIIMRNNIPSPDFIMEGRTLIIPAPGIAAAQVSETAARRREQTPSPPQIQSTLPDDNSGSSRTERHSEATLQAEEQRYIVQSGDTLFRIALRYKVRPEAIAQRNNLASPDRIVEGKALIIPASNALPTPPGAHRSSPSLDVFSGR